MLGATDGACEFSAGLGLMLGDVTGEGLGDDDGFKLGDMLGFGDGELLGVAVSW